MTKKKREEKKKKDERVEDLPRSRDKNIPG
jgi:hypothetical protein